MGYAILFSGSISYIGISGAFIWDGTLEWYHLLRGFLSIEQQTSAR